MIRTTFLTLAALVPVAVEACEAPQTTVLACDLVARPERVELCAVVDEDGRADEMTYTYGTPGTDPDLSFSTDNRWGAPYFDGYVEIDEGSQWGIGLVHPEGAVFLVYAYGNYRYGQIKRAVLQVYPTHDRFMGVASSGQSGGATYHAECLPNTILGNFDFFAP